MVEFVMMIIMLLQSTTTHGHQLSPPSDSFDADGKGIGNVQTDQNWGQ